MAKKKQSTKKKKVQLVNVVKPSKPEEQPLVTMAVHDDLPLPAFPLPSEHVEIDATDCAEEQSGKNGGVLAWLRAHLW